LPGASQVAIPTAKKRRSIVTGFVPPLFSTPLAGGYAEDAYRAMLVLMATALGIGIAIYSTVRWT
jgi:hypothetical protein